MNQSIVLSVFLPVSLGVIMLGLGLGLTLADFKRVLVYPKAVIVALMCQLIVLPIACFGLCYAFQLPPVYAVGMMLLSASPGGTSANLYSHLANGDVALNITLTAVTSVLAILSLPLIVNLSLAHFYDAGTVLPLQFDKVLQVFAIVLVPVTVGMLVRKRFPNFAERMTKPVKIFSLVFLFAVVGIVTVTQWDVVTSTGMSLAAPVLAFNIISLTVGYFVPRFVGIEKRQATAIGMEIGIHNSTLSITIAMSAALLNNPQMALPSAIYGLIAFITAAIFGVLVNKTK